MIVKNLIKKLEEQGEEELVFIVLNDKDSFVWYPDIEVGTLIDIDGQYTIITSDSMSKELYVDKNKKVMDILDERIEMYTKRRNYFKNHDEEEYTLNKDIVNELTKIKGWIED